MIDPTRERQLAELNLIDLCTEILGRSRNELYLNMRFLDLALSSLGFEADWGLAGYGIATDGFLIYYQPEYLTGLFRKGRVCVNRAYLHMVLHCLFGHLDNRMLSQINGESKESLWNLSCDIAMESIIDTLYQKCVYIHPSPVRREFYLRLKNNGLTTLTAEGIYYVLTKMKLPERERNRLAAEFTVDSHSLWKKEQPPKAAAARQNRWKDNREKLQTAMETGSKDASEDHQSLLEQVQAENRERYDYKQFLRRFSVLKEEMQVDADSFDYGFYTYGLSLYGNMPLLEPLETKEIRRIEDFAIAIDTSLSCSGDLVRRFLEETYTILAESETYFRKINVHIIQCDDKIQSDAVITSQKEMKDYMDNFTIQGHGGTDFRPVFEYIRILTAKNQFHKLRGLIYFTDGKGIYPIESPYYDTAFVFIEDNYSDISVPSWAMKLILSPEDLKLEEKEPGGTAHEH
ncbi:MAG: VWA-like domain-containing protein [Lachnospiraceae bacterium]